MLLQKLPDITLHNDIIACVSQHYLLQHLYRPRLIAISRLLARPLHEQNHNGLVHGAVYFFKGVGFDAFSWDQLQELVIFNQLEKDFSASNEFARDEDLWITGPIGVKLEPLPYIVIAQHIKILKLDFHLRKRFTQYLGTLALGIAFVPAHEHNNRKCLQLVLNFRISFSLLVLEQSLVVLLVGPEHFGYTLQPGILHELQFLLVRVRHQDIGHLKNFILINNLLVLVDIAPAQLDVIETGGELLKFFAHLFTLGIPTGPKKDSNHFVFDSVAQLCQLVNRCQPDYLVFSFRKLRNNIFVRGSNRRCGLSYVHFLK